MKYVLENVIFLCLFGVIFFLDVYRGGIQNSIQPVSIIFLDKETAAKRFFENFTKEVEVCDQLPINRHTKLTKSIVSIELGSRSVVEKSLEEAILRIFILFDLPIPNFSYGIAQIKPSTLRKYSKIDLFDSQISEILLDECLSLYYADLIVKNLEDFYSEKYKEDSMVVGLISSDYNGQGSMNLNSYIYRALIRAIYKLQP